MRCFFSDRRIRSADCTGLVKRRGENRASPLGLRSLRPLLVATELLWLLRLRVRPAAVLLAPPLLAPALPLVTSEGRGEQFRPIFGQPSEDWPPFAQRCGY